MTDRIQSLALDREQTLEAIRAAVDLVVRPQQEPRRGEGTLEPDVFLRELREGTLKNEPRAFKTANWLRWRAQVVQENRGALSALLWSCDALREFRGEDVFHELGGPLALALSRFGFRAEIPRCPIERRRLVEAYGTELWAEVNQRDRFG